MTQTTYTPEQLVAMARRRELLAVAAASLRELMWQLPTGSDHPRADPLIGKEHIKEIYIQLIKYRNWYDVEFMGATPVPVPDGDVFVEKIP